MRLGLLGGTFDPIHRGHVAIARGVRDRFALDRLLLLPAGRPPHKADDALTPWAHRFAMAALASLEMERIEASAAEGGRGGASYTVETLEEFRHGLEPGDLLLFALGSDSLFDLPNWREPRRVLELASLAVVPRPGAERAALGRLDAEIARRVIDLAAGPATPAERLAPVGAVYWLDLPADEVSGTGIRQRIRRGDGIGGLVPPAVAAYIAKYRLYAGGDD